MDYQLIFDWFKANWFPIAFGVVIVLLMLRHKLFGWWGKRKYEDAKDKLFPELKSGEYNLINSTEHMLTNLDKVLNDMENPNKNITLLTNMMVECQRKVNEVNKMINNMSKIRNGVLGRYKALGERLSKLKTANGNTNISVQQQPIIPEPQQSDYNDQFLQQQQQGNNLFH